MSRIHGRNGIVYLGVNPADAASPMAFLSDWSINFSVAKVDVTCMGDQNLIWVAGLPDASGDFSGFFDTATAQTYVAAVDGLPRNMYLYPSTASPGQFFSGMVLPDYSLGSGVQAAVALSVTWNSVGPVTRTSASGGLYTAVYTATYP